MWNKKLPSESFQGLKKGIKKATVKLLAYDEKATRAVKAYFETLAARYEVPIYQIRIEIRPGVQRPQVVLFPQVGRPIEISSEHLVSIFGGNVAKAVPGLTSRIETKVAAYLMYWSDRLGIAPEGIFFRLMILANSPVLMIGSEGKVVEEISLTDAVILFS